MNKILAKIKLILKRILGKIYYPKTDLKIKTKKYGSDSCGWTIVDGSVNKNSIVYSFGIGEDASFDAALISSIGLKVYGFDPTPKSLDWVKAQNFSKDFLVYPYGLADFDGEASFNPPENPNHVSHTILEKPETQSKAIKVPMKMLSTIMKELGHNKIDILKMDIEGAEYGVISDLARSSIRPTQILIEFHHRFPNVGLQKTKNAISELRKMGYKLFYVSESGEEFSFTL